MSTSEFNNNNNDITLIDSKEPVFDFINRAEKDLRSLSYSDLVMLHMIMVIDRFSDGDKHKILDIIDDEISKRQIYKQRY